MNDITKLTPTPSNNNYVSSLEEILLQVKNVAGDIIELGTYKGTNSVIFGKLIKKHGLDKKYIGIDTFEGYVDNQLDESVSKENKKVLSDIQESGRWNWSLEKIQELMRECDIDDVTEIYKGDIVEVLPKLKNKVSLLYVDCNVFKPALFGMEILLKNMDENAIICIDEHTVGGETKAIKTFANIYNQKLYETGAKYPDGPPMYIILKTNNL